MRLSLGHRLGYSNESTSLSPSLPLSWDSYNTPTGGDQLIFHPTTTPIPEIRIRCNYICENRTTRKSDDLGICEDNRGGEGKFVSHSHEILPEETQVSLSLPLCHTGPSTLSLGTYHWTQASSSQLAPLRRLGYLLHPRPKLPEFPTLGHAIPKKKKPRIQTPQRHHKLAIPTCPSPCRFVANVLLM